MARESDHMNIRPEGFSEAGISTSNLDAWVDFLEQVGGYRKIWAGDSSESLKGLWGLTSQAVMRECLMGCPGTDAGYIRLYELDGIDQAEIRRDAFSWDSGGIFDLDIRVPRVMDYVDRLHALGWSDFSPQVDWPFGELQVREWLTTGPDAVVLALIQRLAPPLEGFDKLNGFSHVFNSSQIVADMDRALDFYRRLGFQKVLHHEGPLGGRGGEVLGLQASEAPVTPIDLVIIHPQGTMAGSVELVAYKDREGRDLSGLAHPANLGLNLLRFPVGNLRTYALELEAEGIELTSGGIVSTRLEPFGETELLAVQTPDGAWLEFYQAFA